MTEPTTIQCTHHITVRVAPWGPTSVLLTIDEGLNGDSAQAVTSVAALEEAIAKAKEFGGLGRYDS